MADSQQQQINNDNNETSSMAEEFMDVGDLLGRLPNDLVVMGRRNGLDLTRISDEINYCFVGLSGMFV